MSLETTMGFAALEPGLQGPWPTARYHELLSIQTQILNAIGVLTGAFARLEPRWCKLLAERSDMMHPAFVGPLGFAFIIYYGSEAEAAGRSPIAWLCSHCWNKPLRAGRRCLPRCPSSSDWRTITHIVKPKELERRHQEA